MTMLSRVAAFSTIGLIFFGGCKEAAQSELKSEPASQSIPKCDLNKMSERTRLGVEDQITCVKASIDAVGPGWLKLVKDGSELVLAIREATTEVAEFDEDDSLEQADPVKKTEGTLGLTEGDSGSVKMTIWDAFNTLISGAVESKKIRPRWLARCTANFGETSKSIADTVKAVEELNKNQSLSAEQLKALVETVGKATAGMFQLGQIMTTCTPGNDKKSVAGLNKFVKKMTGAIDSVSKSLGAISAIGTCGIGIAKGTVTLVENTTCAIDDLKNLAQQTSDLREAANKYNEVSLDASRRYGAACDKPIRDAAGWVGVHRAVNDCSACCSGTQFSTPGYDSCSQDWKTCMLACAEKFGKNDARLIEGDSEVVSYLRQTCR